MNSAASYYISLRATDFCSLSTLSQYPLPLSSHSHSRSTKTTAAAAMAGGGGTARTLLSLSSTSSSFFCRSLFSSSSRFRPSPRIRVYLGFNQTLSFSFSSSSSATTTTTASDPAASRHAILLERLRLRHLKDAAKLAPAKTLLRAPSEASEKEKAMEEKRSANASSFEELGLEKEVMGALEEMKISVPTEIQCIGVPAVLEGKSVVLGSHTGSGKTLAYLLPLVQLMRRDEVLSGMIMRPRRPRAVVLCPTRELCEQVFRVSKSISHHARFRSTMISGGGRLRPQEDSLNGSIDMVVGTPGRILQHIEEGNMVYGDIKYLVLDEADTMFDRGFGPDIRKFLGPLKNRAAKPDDPGFQTVLVTATMTKAVQSLVDEEFQGIIHLRTSTLHRRVASARHDFIKLSGSENKLEALLQVLEPSLTKGNRVMVFCNTLNSSRAVDHFLSENQILTVNYHGEVPAEERVENLKKFKSEDGDCPTLVCTDLAARGLDLDVDHVIMFDFPSNSIDYLHRTGRTARMGAKGKVTSLVAKKDVLLATRIEEAIKKNESLEALNVNNVRKESTSPRQNVQKGDKSRIIKVSNQKSRTSVTLVKKSPKVGRKATWSQKTSAKAGKSPGIPVATYSKAKKSFASGLKTATSPQKTSAKAGKNSGIPVVTYSKAKKSFASGLKAPKGNKRSESRNADGPKKNKLSVVGFRGRSSSGRSGRSLRPT